MGRKVTYALFHQSIFIPGSKVTGEGTSSGENVGNTLPIPKQPNAPLEMWETPTGIEVLFKNVRAVIPYANVVSYVPVEEKKTATKVVAPKVA